MNRKQRRRLRRIKKMIRYTALAPVYIVLYYAQLAFENYIKPAYYKVTRYNRLNHIYNGWKNYVFESPEIEQMAKYRAEKCAACPFMIEMRSMKVRENNLLNRKSYKCKKCGCPLSAKLRSKYDHCPVGRW
jgi:hypothetical protein